MESIPPREPLTSERHPLLLFFDGECVFCDRWVNRVKDADADHRIRYGTKQGGTFQEVARQHPEVAGVESVVVVARRLDGSEKLLIRTAAIRQILAAVTGFSFFKILLQIVPTPMADLGYRIFSKLRKRVFGRLASCRVPSQEEKCLYVD